MKNVLKRSLSVILAITIIFSSAYVGLGEVDFGSLFAVKANAASVDDWTFRLNNDGVSYSVTNCSEYASGELIIPGAYNGLPVTSIGAYAFYGCESLTTITIPDSVTSIGVRAFYGCTSLTSIAVPDSVTSIGDEAFSQCEGLISVTIGDSVTTIGESAFQYCKSLTSLTIGEGVTSIGEYAFRGCASLTSITISDTVTSIGYDAFDYCTSLSSVYITDITAWCNIDFSGNSANPLSKKGGDLYLNNELVTSLVIPDGVTSIGDYAFYNCTSLTSITIPDSVTSIGEGAFEECTSLTSVTIGNSVTSIGEGAFEECTSLTSITIPDSVISIGKSVFCECTSLTSIIIPGSVTSIDEDTFWNCTSLSSITIPDSITSIGEDAFSSCTSLTSITIPDSVTNIGDSAFSDCTSLIAINVDVNNDYYSSVDGVFFNKDKTILIQYPAGITNTSYTIPEGVTSIREEAFEDCTSLTSITIPDSVTSIDNSAFSWCESLISITIPDSVTSIGTAAFAGCASLTSITIPDSVTSIGDWAFSGCTSLTSVAIPDSVTSIGDYAFWDCTSLTTIIIPDSVTSIGSFAFYECTSLRYVFFTGNEEDWSMISIEEYNTCLTDAAIHYESTDHTVSDWIIKEESECVLYGCKYKECTVCKKVLTSEDIPPIGHIESDWITDKKATVNTAGSKYKKCIVCGDTLETDVIPQLKCAKPTISKIENKDYGVRFEWKAVSGADSYKVYRKVSGGSYKLLGTTKTAYADNTAKNGTKYYYVVKAVNEAGDSEKSASKGIIFLAMPAIKTIANVSTGVKLTWGKVSGAEEYKVYRKTSSGSYAYIGKTTSTSYTDKTAKSGTKYTYVVKAVKDSSVSKKSASKSITFLSAPQISGASSGKSGVTVKWGKIKGAEGYIVYRKASDGDWKKLGKVKGNTKVKYLDETPRKGVTYQYKVKAYKGSSTSVSSSAYKIKCKY